MSYFNNTFNDINIEPAIGYDANHGGEYQISMESMEACMEISKALAKLAAADYAMTHTVKSVAVMESYVPEEMAEEYTVTMESMAGDVFTKVKDFIKKLWAKIKAFFLSIVRSVDLMFKSTKEFVNKYKDQLTKLNLGGFRYTTFRYTIEAANIGSVYENMDKNNEDVANDTYISAKIRSIVGTELRTSELEGNEGAFKDLDDDIDRYRANRDERIDSFRGSFLNQDSTTADQFREDLQKKMRDGASTRSEITIVINELIRDIENSTKLRENIMKAQRDSDNFYKKKISQIDAIEKAVKDKGAGATFKKGGKDASFITKSGSKPYAERAAKFLNILSGDISARQAVANTAFAVWNEAVKERDSEYKKIFRAALSYKAS